MDVNQIIKKIMNGPHIDIYDKENIKKQIIHTIDIINNSADFYKDYVSIACALNNRGYIENYAKSKNYIVDHVIDGKEDNFSYCNIPAFDILAEGLSSIPEDCYDFYVNRYDVMFKFVPGKYDSEEDENYIL